MDRRFQGIFIPAEVWTDKRLNAIEKMVLMEIYSLDIEDGCFASNQYLADFCQCSERKISDSITKLKDLGYVYLKSFDGRVRKLGVRLAKFAFLPSKICEAENRNIKETKKENQKKKQIQSEHIRDYEERVYTKEELEKHVCKIDDFNPNEL